MGAALPLVLQTPALAEEGEYRSGLTGEISACVAHAPAAVDHPARCVSINLKKARQCG